MGRTTMNELRGQWGAYIVAAGLAGFDTDGWTLHMGNGSQGVAFRATRKDQSPAPGTIHDGMHNAFIGMTRGEAYLALRHMTMTLRAVTENRS